MDEKIRLQNAYDETDYEWNNADLKFKKDKITNYFKILELNEERNFGNEYLMIEELEPKELNNYLNIIHSQIMKINKENIRSLK